MGFEIQGKNLINFLANLQKGEKIQTSTNVNEPLLNMKKDVAQTDNVYESMGVSLSQRTDKTFEGMETIAPEFAGIHNKFKGNLALTNPEAAGETLGSIAKFTKYLAKAPEVEKHLEKSPYQFT